MKRTLEYTFIVMLAFCAVALISLGIFQLSWIDTIQANQVDWSKMLAASADIGEAKEKLGQTNGPNFNQVDGALRRAQIGITEASNKQTFAQVLLKNLAIVCETLNSKLPASEKKERASIQLACLEYALSSEANSYLTTRREQVYTDARLRVALVFFLAIETLLSVALAIYCLRERNRNQELLSIANNQLEQVNQKLEALSQTDPLTGCLNRRGFENVIKAEHERVKRSKRAACVVLIDCDDFKKINERFGHAGGDYTLKAIAKTLRETMRGSDHVCRIGGDEFMILCPETDIAAAKPALERLIFAISSEPIELDERHIMVTVSAGAAQLPAEQYSIEDMLLLTRESLQMSKSGGKNRVDFGV